MDNAEHLQSRKSPKGSQKILLGSRLAITLSAFDYVTPSCILLSSSKLSPMQTVQHCWSTTPNIIGCCMLHCVRFHTLLCYCCVLLGVVAQSLKPTFLFSRDRRALHNNVGSVCTAFSNIVGATHAHYTWSPKSNGLYPSHDALQVRTLLGVVASVCTPL